MYYIVCNQTATFDSNVPIKQNQISSKCVQEPLKITVHLSCCVTVMSKMSWSCSSGGWMKNYFIH